jgi:hypothetical protein
MSPNTTALNSETGHSFTRWDFGSRSKWRWLRLLARSAATVGLPRRRHLAVVVRAELPRRCAAAFASQDRPRRHALLFEQVVGKGQRRTEMLPAVGCPVLRKVGDCFEGEVCIGDQVAKRQQRTAVGWHTFMV